MLVTCHDRRDMTLKALGQLLVQVGADADVHFYVTDDGSTDGTAEELRRLPAALTLVRGDGHLYWAAGMAVAEQAAMNSNPDYLLWLNDDTFLDVDGLQRLLAVSEEFPEAIIVGATRDPDTGDVSYGGRRRISRWHPQRFERLPDCAEVQFADTINGNVVLVPRRVRAMVGPIDGRFPHAYADDDYGLRARKLGALLVQAPGTVAECRPNREEGPILRGPKAWKALQDPKGLPWRAQARFLHRHGGAVWWLSFAAQQLNLVVGLKPVRGGRVHSP